MFRGLCSNLIRSARISQRKLADNVRPPRQVQPQTPSSSAVWTSGATDENELETADDDETALSEDVLTEQEVEKLIASLRRTEDAVPIVGSGLVKDPTQRMTLSKMTSPDDTTSHPASQWRKPIYTDSELDASDLSKAPSRTNPHPFDPSLPEISAALPPTHARSMAAYVNHNKVLQNLLDLGVDLLDIDTKTKLSRHFVRMDWKRDVLPRLQFLVQIVGVDKETLGSYLTRNPFFLIQSLDDMYARVNYLKSKKFNTKMITKVVTEHRYWLNTDVKTIDARLGWVQRQFELTGNQLREVIFKEPRVIMFGLGPLTRIVLMLNKEMGFTKLELKTMFQTDPRLFMMDASHIQATYNYLVLVMRLPNERIVEYPLALRCSVAQIRRRHDFLKRVNKAIYDPELPNYVTLEALLQPSDKKFAEGIARIRVESYNRFLKSL